VKANGKNIISFIGTKVTAGCGSIPGTYIRTEVKPYHGGYRLLVTYDDKAESPEAPENPVRILGIDLGVDNLIAAAGNYGSVPFLIKGGYMKSLNQRFNKERARLISELTKGNDSRHSVKNSRRLDAVSRKRDERIRDFFYKCAHF
jgi:putative transposase